MVQLIDGLFVQKLKIAVYRIKHHQTQETPYDIGDEIVVIADSVCRHVMLVNFNETRIDDGDRESYETDFVQ